MTTIRALRAGEEEAFLELLDGWPFSDGRRGRDFFRKYVEGDDRYAPENVWVAEDGGRFVTCVQIFPRDLRIGERTITAGGIGSVFTAPSHRRRGLAEDVLEACTEAMRDRGMSLSLLSGTRARWYASLGWQPWPSENHLLAWRGEHARTPQAFEPADLEQIVELHARYTGARPGCVQRSRADWQSSLRIAGNPEESIWVSRREGRVVAYVRVTDLGPSVATEWGREPEAASDLADLLAAVAASTPKQALSAPRLADDELEVALRDTDLELVTSLDPTDYATDPKSPLWMLKPLDAGAWCFASEAELRDALPPGDFCFWPADRF